MSARDQKISICLPVFNGSKYLAEAIESVLGQSHGNLELLVSDDLSTDDSAEIVANYASKDPRVIYWKNESKFGIFANYNQCLRRASGSFIKPFAQDDVFEPHCCERLLDQLLDNENVSLVTAARAVIDHKGRETVIERFFDHTVVIPGLDVIREYARTFVYKTGTPCQVMFRKNSVGSGFNTLYTLSGDIECFLRILESGDFMYLDEVLVKFRRHSESVTVAALKDMSFVSDSFRLAAKYAKYFVESGSIGPLVHKPLIEGLIRKVNNAIYDRKIDFSELMAGRTVDSDSNGQLDFETIAYQLLFYASEMEMLIEQSQRTLKKEKNELKKQLTEAELLHLKLENNIADLHEKIDNMRSSGSWKITRPLRWLRKPFF